MQIELLDGTAPIITFSPLAWAKTWILVEECAKEVGWFGEVEELPDNMYCVTDIHIPSQQVTHTETDIDAAGLGELAEEIGLDRAIKLLFWGHSHANMGVTPSGTDVTTALSFTEYQIDYLACGIFNKARKMRLDLYHFNNGIIFKDLNGSIYTPEHEELRESLQAEIKDKVEEVRYVPAQSFAQHGGVQPRGTVYSNNYNWNRRNGQSSDVEFNEAWGKNLVPVGSGHGGRAQRNESDVLDDDGWFYQDFGG